jgi:S-adenosylmethionine:tRNA ribosyltransferase-isomerase
MTDPRTLSIKDFSYNLPDGCIARYPLPERDASKLLIYKKGDITESIYRHLDEHIPPGSLLIFNDTKVVEARLLFQKPTGGEIEIFCLEPHEKYADMATAMQQQKKILWNCLIGGASKWKHGQILERKIKYEDKELILCAKYIEKLVGCFVIELSWNEPGLSFAEMLHLSGAIPLPPYIKREPDTKDAERYQTIYAHCEGSVAAPTAGLHFTRSLFSKLHGKKIETDFVTLHVGAATFKPVKTENLGQHEMHAEYITFSRELLENLIQHIDDNTIAVGTTSLRTIESLYWLGVKLAIGNKQGAIEENPRLIGLSQWEPYELMKHEIPAADALQMLLDWMRKNQLSRFFTKTQILVAPGYKPKIVNGLITNFHQPESTLLLLIAALIGKDWKRIYDYALQKDFRFLSYGDGCLLWFDR